MTSQFKLALALSVGAHAAAFAGLPITSPVEFDVERGETSVEIYLVHPPQAVVGVRPQPEAPPEPAIEAAAPEEPAPQTVIAPEARGAISEVLPGYLRNPPPVYPKSARERGDEGTVLLEAQVLPSGRCGAVRVLESSGHAGLDEAAAEAIRRWQFKPARRANVPVAVWVDIPVRFRLLDVSP